MNNDDRFVDVPAIAWGCLTSIATTVILVGVGFLLLFISGLTVAGPASAVPPWTNIVSGLLAVLALCLSGYVVAWKARTSPIRQALIFCAVYIAYNVLNHLASVAFSRLFYATFSQTPSLHPRSYLPDFRTLGWWLVSIPFILVGARLGSNRNARVAV